jgi:hypothetical protein
MVSGELRLICWPYHNGPARSTPIGSGRRSQSWRRGSRASTCTSISDSLDSSEATANEYTAPGGPSLDRLLESIRLAAGTLPVAAAAITAYDPSLDDDGRTIRAARRIAVEIARGGRER